MFIALHCIKFYRIICYINSCFFSKITKSLKKFSLWSKDQVYKKPFCFLARRNFELYPNNFKY